MGRFHPLLKPFLLLGFFIALSVTSYAQEGVKKNFPTKKVNKKTREDKKKNRPKKKKIVYIIKKSTKNTLYGNPCAVEVTRKMGFEFAIEEKTEVTLKSFYGRLKNNFGSKMRLLVTRGPFWRLVANKRIKDCKKKSGDEVG